MTLAQTIEAIRAITKDAPTTATSERAQLHAQARKARADLHRMGALTSN